MGLIIGHLGLEAGDRVLDAGTGTGVLAVFLGRLGLDVVTYERNAEFAENARENVAVAGVAEQVEVRADDVLDAIEGAETGAGDRPVTEQRIERIELAE